jgi:hypothetical protein
MVHSGSVFLGEWCLRRTQAPEGGKAKTRKVSGGFSRQFSGAHRSNTARGAHLLWSESASRGTSWSFLVLVGGLLCPVLVNGLLCPSTGATEVGLNDLKPASFILLLLPVLIALGLALLAPQATRALGDCAPLPLPLPLPLRDDAIERPD